jgi:signal peptidase I
MNWEMIGWAALAISGLVIVFGFFRKQETIKQTANGAEATHPNVWLEIAWPIFAIVGMAMLTFKEVLGFATVLLLATTITGLIWAIDAFVLSKKRAKDSGDPVVVEMAKSFFPVILVVFLLRSFLYEPFKIPSGSMVPTLLVGDFILVNKYTFGIRLPVINKKIIDVNLPKSGDVMVFRYPENPSKDFIKRVIGTPGDTVEYKSKRLTINGQPVATEKAGIFTEVDERMGMTQFDQFSEKLGDKSHSMMVNPRYPVISLSGVRQFKYNKNCVYSEEGVTCKVPEGHYFMMGDSRDNSDDSRYWGFVPEENIVGKAVLIWMNFGAFKRMGQAIE